MSNSAHQDDTKASIPTQPGMIIVISAASGTGKTTLARKLIASRPDCEFSISHTTRPPRAGERNGKDYHFVCLNQFLEMIQANEFVEFATVHGNYYGTSHQSIRDLTQQGSHVILDIDYQGAYQIRQKIPEAVLVFVLPPDYDTLRKRLSSRGTDDQDVIRTRMKNAIDEIAQFSQFDYAIINDDFDEALRDFEAILRAEIAHRNTRLEIQQIIDFPQLEKPGD